MNNWKDIWNRKKEKISADELSKLGEFEAFSELKRLDGFDVAVDNPVEYYRYFYNSFETMYHKVLELLGVEIIRSVYEIGCGSGANLYMFKRRNPDINIGGVDYSEIFVNYANQLIRNADIVCDEASHISENPKFELVMSDSVFQYFKDLNYAESVLSTMMKKCNGVVFLGEIHDAEKKEDLLQYRKQTIKGYDEKYKDLSKLFFEKEWLKNIAESNNFKVEFEDLSSEVYLNSKFVYNCYFYKW